MYQSQNILLMCYKRRWLMLKMPSRAETGKLCNRGRKENESLEKRMACS